MALLVPGPSVITHFDDSEEELYHSKERSC
jgi:hypothetical protein